MNKYSQLTVCIHTSLLKRLLEHLRKTGINHLYSSFGRSVTLSEVQGLATLFRSSDLASDPVEILYFFVPLEYEAHVMKSIIKVCHLDIPGRGSVFSKHVSTFNGQNNYLICDIQQDMLVPENDLHEISLFHNLTQISCTVSKGLADDIARLLLFLGVVPVISNASGTGLRDQLGLLRITIPREKEFLSIIVGEQEASTIMDKIVGWGKLDRPGRGFIWQNPVSKGLINFKASQRNIGQAASTEQIIAAIDSLKGNFSWRQGSSALKTKSKRDYFKGQELIMQVNEGESIPISKAMIQLGISGATVQSLRTLSSSSIDDNIVTPQEIVRVVITDEQLLRVKSSITKKDSILSETHINIIPATKAFNFKRPT
jgi:nitrogen regulatory protein PII